MNRRHMILGILIGLVAAWGMGRWMERAEPSPPMLPEFGPPMRDLVVHHVGGSTATLNVMTQLMAYLSHGVTVYVVCPDEAAFAEFEAAVSSAGGSAAAVRPVVVDHPMTAWSRDRWVVLPPAQGGDPVRLLRPRGEAAADAWPQRRGDERIAADLAAHADTGSVVVTSPLYFDAGDLLADDWHVFVTRAVLDRNPGMEDHQELLRQLERELGRPAVLLADGPDHHAGMFMMSIGGGVALVGDPAWGSRLLQQCDAPPQLPGGVDDSAAMQRQFDAVAARLESIGYRVERVPTVVGRGTKAYLTYVNVLLDVDNATGQRIVYLPFYRNADPLNTAARAVWEKQGWMVRNIDCTEVFEYGGTLHCLVNVLRRSDRP